jgi:hypothetical protein
MKKRKLHLSASAIAAFKACPTRFKNAYHLGIRPDDDTESKRVGSNWHRVLDISTRKPGSVCERCAKKDKPDPNCTLCAGTGFLPDNIMDAVTRELNRIYEGKTFEGVELERVKLFYTLIGYRWYYEDCHHDTITREQKFGLSLINPASGRALPGVKLVGKIDKVIDYNAKIAIEEHKSTSSSVDPDSDFWGHLNLDTQTKLYLYAIRRMQAAGELTPWKIGPSDPPINTILYDAWHKPGISPKKLTQADSKKFVGTGEYMGQKFVIANELRGQEEIESNAIGEYRINGVVAEIEPGKKEGTFAIKETPEMYGARLLADIGERPEFYFRRVEVTRTDKEMEKFEWELLHIYRTIQSMAKSGHWYSNEFQCEAKYPCDYIGQCYNGIELSADNIPDGMKCIFRRINNGKCDTTKTKRKTTVTTT